ncbi:MAG: lipoyl synthase [Candidatus Margulisiibacteriota bacterium]
MQQTPARKRLPEWLRKQPGKALPHRHMRSTLGGGFHTVCESALCPNRGECFSRGTVTFMILGNTCTRNCTFCAVESEQQLKTILPLDPNEPEQVAKAAYELKLKHVVVTSVTRDDLPDEGAGQFADTIKAIRAKLPEATVEVLTPDFNGNTDLLDIVLTSVPDVFNHNVETVPRLYPEIRPQADYQQSLGVLRYAAKGGLQSAPTIGTASGVTTKSGLMLGLGETKDEVVAVLRDLYACGVDIVTIGQYLAPSPKHAKVVEYIHPDQFEEYKTIGEKLGIKQVFAGPLVRSSYRAEEVFIKNTWPGSLKS